MSSSSLNPNTYEIRLTKGEFTILLESDDLFFASRQLELWYQFFLEAKPVTWGGIMASQLPQRSMPSGDLAKQHQAQQEQLREITDALSELFIDSPGPAPAPAVAYTPAQPVAPPIPEPIQEPVSVAHTRESVALPFESFNEPRGSLTSFTPSPTETDLPDIDQHEAMLAKLEETQKLQQHRIANPPTPEELALMQQEAAAASTQHLSYEGSKPSEHDAGLIDSLSMPAQTDTETLKAMPATPEPISETARAQLINTIQQPVENMGISVELPPSQAMTQPASTSAELSSTPPVNNSGLSVDNSVSSDLTPDPVTLLNAPTTAKATADVTYVASSAVAGMAVISQDNTDFEQILDAALTDMSAGNTPSMADIPLSEPEPMATPEPVMPPSPLPAPATNPEDDVETLYIDSFKDLSELMPANTDPSQWAMLAGYFMQQLAGQPAFTLKDVNVQMAECNLGSVNHAHLQTLLSQQWLEVLPDKTGTALATDYRLTEDGITMAEEMLNVV